MREAIFILWIILLLSLSSCSHLIYHPNRTLYYPPDAFGLSYKEIAFKAQDGTQLYGWFLPAQRHSKLTPARGTIIQFHGNAQNMSSHYISLAWAALEGYNLFTFSYRGYGKSLGSPDQRGVYLDSLAALEQAWELNQQSGGKQFIVYGQSLGGAIAMRALQDFPYREKLSLVVMDSTFLSYKKVAQSFMASHWLSWIFSPLALILVSDEYAAQSVQFENSTQFLVIHDRTDPVVPFQLGSEIYRKNKNKKEIWALNDGRHIGVFDLDHLAFRDQFMKVLRDL